MKTTLVIICGLVLALVYSGHADNEELYNHKVLQEPSVQSIRLCGPRLSRVLMIACKTFSNRNIYDNMDHSNSAEDLYESNEEEEILVYEKLQEETMALGRMSPRSRMRIAYDCCRSNTGCTLQQLLAFCDFKY